MGKLLLVSLLSIAMLCFCYSVSAEVELQGQGFVKALSCFDNKLIYAGCDEAYRLNPSGDINVPPEDTDFFCSGPCLAETQLVLNCIDNMLSNFMFYNKATVPQIRYALNAGCSYSSHRGNFNFGDYIGGETSEASKILNLFSPYLFMLVAGAAAQLI